MDTERVSASAQGTGDSRVDEAVADLAALGESPLGSRPAVLQAVHDRLREILGELGEPVRPGEPGRRGAQGELGGNPRR